MKERLATLLFLPHKWVDARALTTVAPAYVRRKMHQILPLGHFKASILTDSFSSRLLLLHLAEWNTLGMAVAALPYAGSLQYTLDNTLRKAIRSTLTVKQLAALDQWASTTELALPHSNLERSGWKDAQQCAWQGVAAVRQLCDWTPQQQALFDLRIAHFSYLPAAQGLCWQHLEQICPILLPELQWLWPSANHP